MLKLTFILFRLRMRVSQDSAPLNVRCRGESDVLPPGPIRRSSYVDDNSCLICEQLTFRFQNVLVSRHPLVSVRISVRHGMTIRCHRGEGTRDVNPPPSAKSHPRASDSRLAVQ
jgi:hypothetical protein